MCLLPLRADAGASATCILPCCRAYVHKGCAAAHVLAKAEEALFPVLCPALECRARLPAQFLGTVFSPEQLSEYNRRAVQYKELKTLTAEEGSPRTQERYRELGMQRCPQCRFWVEKSKGCNHMRCRCGKEFCHLCGADYTGYTHAEGTDCSGGRDVGPNLVREPQAPPLPLESTAPDRDFVPEGGPDAALGSAFTRRGAPIALDANEDVFRQRLATALTRRANADGHMTPYG